MSRTTDGLLIATLVSALIAGCDPQRRPAQEADSGVAVGGGGSGGVAAGAGSSPVCHPSAPCAAGEVCIPVGCGVEEGTCVQQPSVGCPTNPYAPVCSCNGQTYANDCERILVGEPVRHQGPCRGEVTVLTDKASYGQGEAVQAQVVNGSEAIAYLPGCVVFDWERLEGGQWVEQDPGIDCKWEGNARGIIPGETYVETASRGGGTFRLRVTYGLGCTPGLPLSQGSCKEQKTAISASFTILPTMAQCEQLAKDHSAALKVAKKCNWLVNALQCQDLVKNNLICPCQTYVQDKTDLTALEIEWAGTRCPEVMRAYCPPYPCPPPGLLSGYCQPDDPGGAPGSSGTCVDDME